MNKQTTLSTQAAFGGAQLAWNETETVTVKDLNGDPVNITVRAGMPLTDIFDFVMEPAVARTAEGHYNKLFGDMIMAQAIIDHLTDLPLLDNPEQMDIDQCYELVFGYHGIIRKLDPNGPARFLIARIQDYVSDLIEMINNDPDIFDDADDEGIGDIMDLEDLRSMRRN